MLAATLTGVLWSGPFWVTVGYLLSKCEVTIVPLKWSERLDGEADLNRKKT